MVNTTGGQEAFMGKMRMLLRAAGIVAVVALAGSCATEEMLRVRSMEIAPVDLSQVRDGTHRGQFTYGGYTYIVEVSVSGGRITSIVPVANRDTGPAKAAEGVIPRILEEQRNDVDVVSGATTTSKALLKAVETALSNGRTP
jgi:uncharacterized protein with FMN-binding domain